MNLRIGPWDPRSRWSVPAVVYAACALGFLWAACVPGAPDGSAVSGPSEDGSDVTLAWDRPTTDAEGNSLEDLSGFRIYVATESPVEPEGAERVEVGDTTRHTFSDLEPGVYFLAVSAVDTAGNESELSDEVRAEVGNP